MDTNPEVVMKTHFIVTSTGNVPVVTVTAHRFGHDSLKFR